MSLDPPVASPLYPPDPDADTQAAAWMAMQVDCAQRGWIFPPNTPDPSPPMPPAPPPGGWWQWFLETWRIIISVNSPIPPQPIDPILP